jgi:Kef-type K+ transport system membrane component KefB
VPDIRLDESSCEISVSIDYSTDSFCDDKVDILESCGLGSAAEFDLEAGSEVGLEVVGLEVDIPKMKKTSGKAGVIALFSVALPFCLGAFALAPHLYKSHSVIDNTPVPELSFKLFVGTCMSVTAFPVLARIITEKGLHRLNIGALAVACAALTDVVAWALLAVVLAVQESQSDGGALDYKPILVQLALIVVYILVYISFYFGLVP